MTHIPEPECSPELIDYAAGDAARVLIKSWEDTLRDDPDFTREKMAGDIDALVDALKARLPRADEQDQGPRGSEDVT